MPTAVPFVGEIEKYIRELQPASTRDELLAAFIDARDLLQLASPEPLGLEPFFEGLDDALDAHYGRSAPGGASGPVRASRAIERLHYETKRVIHLHCDVTDAGRADWLEVLLRRLVDFAPYPVVSFNYDSVIETACRAQGLRLAESVFGENVAKADIDLIKVHGSVTWLAGRRGGLKRSRSYSNAIISGFGELRTPILETPLIYPSRRKMPLHAPFMANALRLQALLADPGRTAIIAVGYSFPDAHMLAWLSEAIRARPDLTLYLVDPDPARPLRNLVGKLPVLPWTERLKIVPMGFKQAIQKGFEEVLRGAEDFGPAFAAAFDGPIRTASPPLCFEGRVSGLGASPDGRVLYVAEAGDTGRLHRVALDAAEPRAELFASDLKDPRGIAVRPDGDLLVVQNRLFRPARLPSRGAGGIVRLSADGGHRSSLTRPRLAELRELVRVLRSGARSATLWEKAPSILRWPTDVAVRPDGAIFATEARALVQIMEDGGPPRRVHEGELLFNLHGLDAAEDGGLIGVEQGIGQDFSWGRLTRFLMGPGGVTVARSVALEGDPRLMGVCYVRSARQVVVTKAWSWPLGGLFVLDYPALDNARFHGGFDMPQKVEYVAGRELLAVSTRRGVELIGVGELDG